LPKEVRGARLGLARGSCRRWSQAGSPGQPTETFALLVPESALREGRNRTDVYEVDQGGRTLTLLACAGDAPTSDRM